MPGTIGLNNLRATDYMNVVIQVLFPARKSKQNRRSVSAHYQPDPCRLSPSCLLSATFSSWTSGTKRTLQRLFLQSKKCFDEQCCRYATPLALQFGQLLKRMWNPRNFKGQVHHIPKIKPETLNISRKAHP